MAGERLLQVRVDEGRIAVGHAQSNEAALLRAQRRITTPHCRGWFASGDIGTWDQPNCRTGSYSASCAADSVDLASRVQPMLGARL